MNGNPTLPRIRRIPPPRELLTLSGIGLNLGLTWRTRANTRRIMKMTEATGGDGVGAKDKGWEKDAPGIFRLTGRTSKDAALENGRNGHRAHHPQSLYRPALGVWDVASLGLRLGCRSGAKDVEKRLQPAVERLFILTQEPRCLIESTICHLKSFMRHQKDVSQTIPPIKAGAGITSSAAWCINWIVGQTCQPGPVIHIAFYKQYHVLPHACATY